MADLHSGQITRLRSPCRAFAHDSIAMHTSQYSCDYARKQRRDKGAQPLPTLTHCQPANMIHLHRGGANLLLTPSRLPAQGPPVCKRVASAGLRTSATATTADAQQAQAPVQAKAELTVAVSYLYDVTGLCVLRIDGTLSGASLAVNTFCNGPQTPAGSRASAYARASKSCASLAHLT